MRKIPLPLRLTALPALAAMTVLLLCLLSLLDLSRSLQRPGRREPNVAPLVPESQDARRLDDTTTEPPHYTEEEAFRLLGEAPTKAVVDRLWPKRRYREALYELMLNPRAPEPIRAYLLGLFEKADSKQALSASRRVLQSEKTGESPLLFAALEIVSRHGKARDLELFKEKRGESPQVKAHKESYREALERTLE